MPIPRIELCKEVQDLLELLGEVPAPSFEVITDNGLKCLFYKEAKHISFVDVVCGELSTTVCRVGGDKLKQLLADRVALTDDLLERVSNDLGIKYFRSRDDELMISQYHWE